MVGLKLGTQRLWSDFHRQYHKLYAHFLDDHSKMGDLESLDKLIALLPSLGGNLRKLKADFGSVDGCPKEKAAMIQSLLPLVELITTKKPVSELITPEKTKQSPLSTPSTK